MEMFMLCDLDRYELSARGSMCGREADPLGDAILRLPDDSVATIDLRNADVIDDIAAAVLASAVTRGRRQGVEFSILVDSEVASAALRAAGLSHPTIRSTTSRR